MDTNNNPTLAELEELVKILHDVFYDPDVIKAEKDKSFKLILKNYPNNFGDNSLTFDASRFHNAFIQLLIDEALKVIARMLLEEFFPAQKKIRDEFERSVNKVDKSTLDSLPRNYMNSLIKDEEELVYKIVLWKSRFKQLFNLAKEFGYHVFERAENKYSIYRALAIEYREIVNNIKSRGGDPLRPIIIINGKGIVSLTKDLFSTKG